MPDYAGYSPPTSNNSRYLLHGLYIEEREAFAGILVSLVHYGIVAMLFFRSMRVLLNPTDRRIGWGLVAHTTAMFLFMTVHLAATLNLLSNSYIDTREFDRGISAEAFTPLEYQSLYISWPISLVATVMFLLNQLLVDGLLLYRCYVIYGMNYRVIAFPCFLYLLTAVMAIMMASGQGFLWFLGTAYFGVSLLLNVLLTLMMIGRLVRQSWGIRGSIGSTRSRRLYRAVNFILIESFALSAFTSVLYIILFGTGESILLIIYLIVPQTQVVAPFLIILHASRQGSLTNNSTVSREVGSMHFAQVGSTFTQAPPCLHPTMAADMDKETGGIVIELIPDSNHSEG